MAIIAKQVDILIAGIRNPNTDEPNSNGEVYTYLDGTSTESNLWTDRNKTAKASNPIKLDAQGQAQVYGDNIYKFEIYGPRDDEGNIGPLLETLTGLDIFAGETLTDQWVLQSEDISYDSATSLTVSGGDFTDEYHEGRRIRASGSSTGIIYGTITSSSYDSVAGETTVNIEWDSGLLQDESLDVSLSILTDDNPALPKSGENRYFYAPKTKTVTSATTLTKEDHAKTILVDFSGGSFDIGLPPHADGLRFPFVVIDASNSGNIDDNGGSVIHTLDTLYQNVTLISDGSTWRKLSSTIGEETISTSDPSGGSDGDKWYKVS